MIALILAAGMASRLRPLTDSRPKCLLTVGTRCLLQRTIDSIKAAGINELVVVTGYRGNMIRDFVNENYADMKVTFIDNEDYQTTNNIYSLWLARHEVAGRDFLLLDSDILFDGAIIRRLLDADGTCLAVNRHKLGEEEIKVITDDENRVIEISKVCSIEHAIGESVGIEKMLAPYSAALFKELELMIEKEKLVDIFYERAFERLIPQGHTFKVVDTTDIFSIELDTVEDFNQAKRLIPENIF